MPEDVSAGEYFGYEFAGVGINNSFRFPHEVFEETEDYITERNEWGTITKNWKNATSTPEMIDFTIKTRADWEEHRASLVTWDEKRVDWDGTRKHYEASRDAGKWINYGSVVGYDITQAFVGSERLLMAMAEDPAWVKDMVDAEADILIRGGEELLAKGIDFDGGFFCDDMGYRNGSLFSPRMYREISMPAHKRVTDFMHAHGKPVILHSCGNVKELIPMLIEAGFDCLQPLEMKAGMDVIELKKLYGEKLAFMGGIDVRKMRNPDPSVIEHEISSKIGFAKKGGGYIYHSDHSVPDDISFAQYCRVIELVKKYGAY